MALAKNIEIFEHPLDTVEIVASLRDWTYERSETEVSIIAKGKWADYQISVTWVDDYEGINIVCGFDLKFQKISNNDFDNITQLLESLNQIPSSQRDILVENIKEEALKISKMTWPTKINSNSIKARYNVFFTNVSFLNSQNKLGITNNEELNLIKQINISWNVFVNEIQKTETQISD